MAPLTAISGRTQLLQRQILRADGLTNLERDQLLGNVVAVLAAVQLLEGRIETLIPPGEPLPEEDDPGDPDPAPPAE